jgi:hypothetical protein
MAVSAVGLAVALAVAGCGGDDPAEGVADGPCPGESGFGARIPGADEPLDLCVPDDSVWTIFTHDGWYDVTVNTTAPDGTAYEFRMMFPHHTNSPKLNVTGNLAEARADQYGAWFYYREIAAGGGPVESFNVQSGSFRLGFSDGKVVAGQFERIELGLQDAGTEEPLGTQTVLEGFFSLLTDEPGPRTTD